MQRRSLTSAFILTTAILTGFALRAEDRSLVFLAGPASAEHTQQAAPATASAIRNWLKTPGATAEVRRPGVADSQEFTKFMQARDIEAVLVDAAKSSRGLDAMSYIDTLDRATYAASHHRGQRVVVTMLDGLQLDQQATDRLKQTIDFCRSNNVHVMVVDSSGAPAQASLESLKLLASATGGVWSADAKELDAGLMIAVPVEKAGSEVAAAKPGAAAANPIHTQFIRTREQWKGAGIVSDMGPAHGWLIVEAPFSLLKFEEDNRAGTYTARARITAQVKGTDGKVAWQAKKDVTLKGPLKKLGERKTGNLYLLREAQLSGGKYTLEAQVDDLTANKSWTASEPLPSGSNLPGFAVSGAMFVRRLNESADRLETDLALSHEGKALAPLLDPVFPPNSTFDLNVYFIIYPDIRGGQPEISLEILHDGQVLQRTQLLFNDKIRDTSSEGQEVGTGSVARQGGQKDQFPYLASLRDATFSAGDYEARITVRQDRQTITRSVPFRVAP